LITCESLTITLPLLAKCNTSPTSCNYIETVLIIIMTFCQQKFSFELYWLFFILFCSFRN
jgi:hypothetical protein